MSGMDHLGVPDEFEGDQPQSAIDVVVANLVHITLDRGEDQEIDLTHVGETPRDRVRVGQVEADPPGLAADLFRSRLRSSLVPSRHDHFAAVVGVRLREFAPQPLRATDDNHLSHCPASINGASPRRQRRNPTNPQLQARIGSVALTDPFSWG